MRNDERRIETSKMPYASPKLTAYGSVKTLTHGPLGSGQDGNGQQPVGQI